MVTKREVNAIKAKTDLLDSVGLALKKHGFAKLSVSTVAAEAKMDKTAIYRYYNDFKDLLKAYIDQQEYWLKSLKKYGNTEIEDMNELAKIFIREQIEALMSSEEFRELILWELADKDDVATPITVKREIYSEGILNQSRHILENCGINFNFILAIILGGIYYVTIHKDKYPFCEVDLNQKKHKDELIWTLDWLIDLLFEANQQVSEVEKVAIRASIEGIDLNTIEKITNIERERLMEIL